MGKQFPKIKIIRNDNIIAERLSIASSIWSRSKGLLGKTSIAEGEGLLIRSCNMVHMLFMLFPIDVIFCSSDNVVLQLQPHLKPWKFSKLVTGASYVVELPAGTIERCNVKIGDKLLIIN